MNEILTTVNLLLNLVFLIVIAAQNYTVFPPSELAPSELAAEETAAQTFVASVSEKTYLSPQKLGIICIGWSSVMIVIQASLEAATVDLSNPTTYLSPITGWIPISPLMLLLVGLVLIRQIRLLPQTG